MRTPRKIYDYNPWYELLHKLTAIYIRHSFRAFTCVGKENIPKDGQIILAPNHCNTLMDPFALLATIKQHMVFVARADIFRGKNAARTLNFLKMMPIVRRRDGLRNVVQTDDTIKKSIEVVNNHVPFCILPEGTHRTMHSLLPIGKGIVRIACGAVETAGEDKVYIVPIGLEYGDYFRYRSTLRVEYGKPIDVSGLMAEMKEATPLEVNTKIRSLTGDGIKSNIVYIPDDEQYEATWELVKTASGAAPEFNPQKRFEANKAAAAKIAALREADPEKAQSLLDRAEAFRKARKEARISMHTLKRKCMPWQAVWRTLLAIVLAPLFLFQAVVSAPAWGLAEFVCRKGKDAAFNNSLRCVTFMVVWTVLLIVWAVVYFCSSAPWYLALCWLILTIPAPFWVYDYTDSLRRLVSSWRCLFHKKIVREYRSLRGEMEKL